MHPQVYHSRDIQAWEQRWFARQNSAYGLMQQAAWTISQQLSTHFKALLHQKDQIDKKSNFKIAVCCGAGNNAGDGYLVAKYLQQAGFSVDIYSSELGPSASLAHAYQEALQAKLNIYSEFDFKHSYAVYIDALFGIGLNRELNDYWQNIIAQLNAQAGLKIALDIPSGLAADTGRALPIAIQADRTYTVLAHKAGLWTGHGRAYAGEIICVPLIPTDAEIQPTAQLAPTSIQLASRQAFGHKGSYGHVFIVGGHADMGGAVIMAAEAAFSAGAGKVSVVCNAKHHTAILSRSPNIMVKDIDALSDSDLEDILQQASAVAFGMGLGRDAWAEKQFVRWMRKIELFNQQHHAVEHAIELVLDADSLWFLAEQEKAQDSISIQKRLNHHTYATPHPGEAAKLLGISIQEVEENRLGAIQRLQIMYGGEWVLKGSGSLTLETSSKDQQNNPMWICTAGNAGMGTGGMGDVLAGMIASLKAQLHDSIPLHDIVTLHALAGDALAETGMRGLQAQYMSAAVYRVVNGSL